MWISKANRLSFGSRITGLILRNYLSISPQKYIQKIDNQYFAKLALALVTAMLAGSVHYSTAMQLEDSDPAKADKVWNVSFNGNKTYENVVLTQVVATTQPSVFWKISFWKKEGHDFSEIEVRKDVIRIERFYQRRGFPDVEVNYEVSLKKKKKPWKKEVVFQIAERDPIIIDDFKYAIHAPDTVASQIERNDDISKTLQGGVFRPGKRYQPVKETDVVGRIENKLHELSFAHASADIRVEVDSTAKTASVKLDVFTGPPVKFSNFKITGNSMASDKYILKEADLTPGEEFSGKKIERAQQELFNHHLFRFATISRPDQPEDSTLDMTINIREQSPRSVRLRGGVSIEEILRGEVAWIHRNAFDKAHRFSADMRASFINQRGNLNYQFPQIFNTKSSIIVNPFGEHIVEPGFELVSGGINNTFVYQSSRSATSSFSYEFTRNREELEQTRESLPDSVQTFNISSFQVNGIYGKGVLNRQQGWRIQPSIELSGIFGSASFNFQKFTVDLRRYYGLSRSTTLATRVRGGIIFNVENDSLPTNIRFFNGGTNSVRGFGRQQLGPKRVQLNDDGSFDEFVPTGGRSTITFNLEIRQDWNNLIQNFGMAFFLDGGQVWENVDEGFDRAIQYSAGGGIRYDSPIGPVRFDVGYILNPRRRDLDIFQGQDFGGPADRIGFHFSIGQSF